MIIEILNKLLMTLFFMSCLNTLRHVFYFVQAFIQAGTDEPVKYKLNNRSLLLLGISLGYILTVIIKGISL